MTMDFSTAFALGLLLLTLPVTSQVVSYTTESNGEIYAATTVYETAAASTTVAQANSGSASETSVSTGSSSTTGRLSASTITSAALTSAELPAIQTKEYTGQALLVGTYDVLLLYFRPGTLCLLKYTQMRTASVHNPHFPRRWLDRSALDRLFR